MNIMKLIELLDDEISGASALPLTGKKLVDADKCLDILSDLRVNLPDEMKEAERMVAQKEDLMAQAQEEAEQMVRQAEQRSRELVDDHELTRRAYEQGQQILEQARAEADDLRRSAIRYAQDIMAFLEKQAHRTLDEIEENVRALAEME